MDNDRVDDAQVDVETFRALARSSRVLWRSVQLTWRPFSGHPRERAWVRRPDAYRVETLDGQLLRAGRNEPPAVGIGEWVVVGWEPDRRAVPRRSFSGAVPAVLFGASDDGREIAPSSAAEALAAVAPAPAPRLRNDGLVAWLPFDPGNDTVPMYSNYRWVAMLDPIELADGDWFAAAQARGESTDDHDPNDPDPPPGAITEVRAVEHHGRPALEAAITPDVSYLPRCGCCPLLDGAVAFAAEWHDRGPWPDDTPDGTTFAVRIDRQTGICVSVETLDGDPAHHDRGRLDVHIEAVDDDLPDGFFPDHPLR